MSFGKIFLIALLILIIIFSIGMTALGALFDTGPLAWLNPDSMAQVGAACLFMAVYLAAKYSSVSKRPAS